MFNCGDMPGLRCIKKWVGLVITVFLFTQFIQNSQIDLDDFKDNAIFITNIDIDKNNSEDDIKIISNDHNIKIISDDHGIKIVVDDYDREIIVKDRGAIREEYDNDFSQDDTSHENLNISEILVNIEKINKEQIILNEDLLGPITNDTVVILIQVHKRISYLRHLIISLSMAQDIDKTLIIFSHDFWDEDINQLVRSIDFAAVLQVFYPFSLQTHPDTFPGDSKLDCPRNATKHQATRMNCTNKDWPDRYGHYREAKFAQIKHHWWWKVNYIFNHLPATSEFNGNVLFLEEDHYVSPDFVYTLRLMEMERAKNNQTMERAKNNQTLERVKNNQTLEIICLGTYTKLLNYQSHTEQVSVTDWNAGKHNMGMAFNRHNWNKIYTCSSQFCQNDDYNWDWSLLHISQTCMKDKLKVMLIEVPRVFHIGDCGFHKKMKICNLKDGIKKIKVTLRNKAEYLFPKSLVVGNYQPTKSNPRHFVVNGGWSDKRDHDLCLNMSRRQHEDNFANGTSDEKANVSLPQND